MPYLIDTEEIAIEQALSQGLSQGRQEGEILAQQQAVVEALEIRFDRIPDGLREEIGLVADSARLHILLRAAIRCTDIESFTKEL
jgi:hypothetical protein